MNDIELYDIYDIWYEPSWLYRYGIWLLGAFTALGFFVCIYYWYKKRVEKKKKCWQIALEKLAQLDKKTDYKFFYFDLTKILKEYLVHRYHVDVLSKTDTEMVESLGTYAISKEVSEDLKKIFSGTTEAKFAQQKVDHNARQNDLLVSKHIIKKSMPTQA